MCNALVIYHTKTWKINFGPRFRNEFSDDHHNFQNGVQIQYKPSLLDLLGFWISYLEFGLGTWNLD